MSKEEITWIHNAINASMVNASQVDDSVAKCITDEATRRFVIGLPRAWWMNLALPAETFDSTVSSFLDIVPDGNCRCWLIPEVEDATWPVFDAFVGDIPQIIDDCPFFEYYVVAKDFSWMVAESDHNVFFVCRGNTRSGG